jgi:type II secretory pathway pseudopilin PulG
MTLKQPFPGTSRRQAGFTYLAVLALVALLGAVVGVTADVWHTTMQREKERQLLFVGQQFRKAIERYYLNSPPGQWLYPATLEDMIQDPRYPDIRRYLRRIWIDPVTGKADWDLLHDQNGGIVGLHSHSDAQPIKIGNFNPEQAQFEGAKHYSDWIFLAQPGGRSPTVVAADAGIKQN